MSTQKIAFDEKLQISKDKLDKYNVLNIDFIYRVIFLITLLFRNNNRRRYMFSIIRLNPFLTVLGGFSGSFHNIFVIGFLKICRKCQVITWFRNLFINLFVRKPIGRAGFKIVRRFLEKIGGWILKFFDQFGRRKLFLQTWSWKLSSKRWKFSIRSGFRDRRNRVLHILQYIFNSHFSC